MTLVKIPARSIIVQVAAADGITWLPISSLTSVDVDPSADSAKVDTTTFDSNGVAESRIMQRGASMEFNGFLAKDDTTGVQDTGQARVVTLAKGVAEASVGMIRFRHPTSTQWSNWNAVFEEQKIGGKNNDESSWGAKVVRTGPTTLTAAP